jgi:hypothetical protein
MWDIIAKIGTPFSLAAFALAIAALVARHYLGRRRAEIEAAPEEKRLAMVSKLEDAFDIPVATLSDSQKFALAKTILARRAERFKLLALVSVTMALLLTVVSLFAIAQQSTQRNESTAPQIVLAKQACEAGDPAGCRDLGNMYTEGKLVPKDYALAMTLFKKSCEVAPALGCNNIGLLYSAGEGVIQDNALAVFFFRKSCEEGGNAVGCSNLGDMYANGKGVAKDDARAAALYKKSCDGGFANACLRLKRLSSN